MKHTLGCLLLLVSGALVSFASERVSTFSDLPRGDSIVVRYTSIGCYHSLHYEFTYYPAGEGEFDVEELHMEWSKAKGALVERSRKFIGRISLEKGEAKKLDSLIDWYRNNTSGGCTTIDSIRLTQIHRERVVAEESFVDASCATLMHAEVLTFGQMADALRKPPK